MIGGAEEGVPSMPSSVFAEKTVWNRPVEIG
jgi:hypothetical protein